jgi:hypothetical protein
MRRNNGTNREIDRRQVSNGRWEGIKRRNSHRFPRLTPGMRKLGRGDRTGTRVSLANEKTVVCHQCSISDRCKLVGESRRRCLS